MSITHVSVSRVSDNRNNISWGYDSSQVSSVYIQRSSNGGGYSSLASPNPSSSSYTDTSTQANSWYRYRMQTVEWWGSGPISGGTVTDWVYSGTTYNSPSAPGKPTAIRLTTTSVRVSFSNSGRTQTATEIQRSPDRVSWTTIQTLSGSNVTQLNDNPGGGTWYYRVRNTRGSLVSAWSPISDGVVTTQAPTAPTLFAMPWAVNLSDPFITFKWKHNPLDGSDQTEAQVRYSIDNGVTWFPYAVYGSNSTFTFSNDFANGTYVLWQVRTKGIHVDYGPWSNTGYFYVYQVPQLSITEPVSLIITEMPIGIRWEFDDAFGDQKAAHVILLDKSGQEVYREHIIEAGNQAEIHSTEFLPTNHEIYTLRVEATSSTTLTGVAEIQLEMDYTEPFPPTGEVIVDEDLRSATLTVFASTDSDPGVPDTVSVGIYRKHADGSLIYLIDQVPSGTSFYDAYPPTDQDFEYIFVSYANTGAMSQYAVPAYIPSYGGAIFNYGEGFRKVAMLLLDVSYGDHLDHSYEIFETAGNARPLIFFGEAEAETGSVSGTTLKDPSMLNLPAESSIRTWRNFSRNKDVAILRYPGDDPILINPSVDMSRHHKGQLTNTFANTNVRWTRVREDGVNGLAIK